MRIHMLLPIVLFAAMPLAAQSAPSSLYAESFRNGETRIVEESFEAKLTPQDSAYRERIKDSRGDDRYVFSILPRVPEGDTKITSWQVRLAAVRRSEKCCQGCPMAPGAWRLRARAGRRQAHHQSG